MVARVTNKVTTEVTTGNTAGKICQRKKENDIKTAGRIGVTQGGMMSGRIQKSKAEVRVPMIT
jgi:hypothetical protein